MVEKPAKAMKTKDTPPLESVERLIEEAGTFTTVTSPRRLLDHIARSTAALSAMSDGMLREALRNLYEACKRHDPDDWDGEPAMIEAHRLLEAGK